MLEKLYLKETIKRFNDQELKVADTKKGREQVITFIRNMMEMLNFRRIDYEIHFDRIANGDNGDTLCKVTLVCTMI